MRWVLRLAASAAAAVILLAGSLSAAAQASQKPAPVPRVRYSLGSGGGIVATVDGKVYRVTPKSSKCLNIVSQRDFAGTGVISALVMDITACGGNCCPNQFFFVSYAGDGQFKVSKEFADSWKDPVIERWKGRWSVVVVSNNAGMNRERPVEYTRRFELQDGEAVKMEEHQRQNMKALVEIWSDIFKGTPGEKHTIKYDLDGDGKKDTITCTYWERWGSMFWSVEFANGKTFKSDLGCKRIGVLATKTEGVHDLVCDQDVVFKWDGEKYVQ